MRCISFFALTLALICVSSSASAQGAPDSLSFQGRLADSTGAALDTTVGMTFKLYKDGSAVWTETHASVTVTDGIFNVLLGGTTPLDTMAFNAPLELGITVGTDAEISPRTPLAAAAYAKALPGLYTFYREDGDLNSYNVVGGAANNVVEAGWTGATIGGGGGFFGALPLENRVIGHYGTVGGGHLNRAALEGTVGGGNRNEASGFRATVGGGFSNMASDTEVTVGGGNSNTASALQATVGGGLSNNASGTRATVGGGRSNNATATESTVGGGFTNTASGTSATVGGGRLNTASGIYSTVPGGFNSVARVNYSFAAGFRARANQEGTFVWSDASLTPMADSFASTGTNQFLIRAAGGVGIGTNSPANQFHVADTPTGTGAGNLNAYVALVENLRASANSHGLAIKIGTQGDPTSSARLIAFFDGDLDRIGQIQGNGSGGVSYNTSGADYAEYLPRINPDEAIEAGDVVGLFDGGVSRRTVGASRAMVVTDRAAVLGNMPPGEDDEGFEQISFIGQVPVKSVGKVDFGDYIVPSGLNDGTGIAVRPFDLKPEHLAEIVGRAWESNSNPGLKKVIVEVGLDHSAAVAQLIERQNARIDKQQLEIAELRDAIERAGIQ